MATKKRVKRYNGDDESMVNAPNRGIVDQTEEEAANEAEMMPRRRAILEGERDEKALPEGYKVTPEAPAKVKPRAMIKEDYAGKQIKEMMKAEKEANLLRDKESGRTRGTRSYGDAVRIMSQAEQADPNRIAQRKNREAEDRAIRGGSFPAKNSVTKTGGSYRRPLDSLDKQMSESNLDMSMAQRDPEATAKFLRSGEAGNGRGSYYKSDGRAVIQKQNEAANEMKRESRGMKKGGAVKKMASGGSVSSASSRGDGIAQRGKTRGKMC